MGNACYSFHRYLAKIKRCCSRQHCLGGSLMVCAPVLHSPAVVSMDGQAGAQAGSNKSLPVSGAIFINHKLIEVRRALGDVCASPGWTQSPVHQAAQDPLRVSTEHLQGQRSHHHPDPIQG